MTGKTWPNYHSEIRQQSKFLKICFDPKNEIRDQNEVYLDTKHDKI